MMETITLPYPVPYYAQVSSVELAEAILTERMPAELDPRWAETGAATPEIYAYWTQRACGVACVKMCVEALGILPPFRRMGLGRLLLAQAEEEAKRMQLRRLELQVSTGNSPALSLYLDEGFWPIPRRWTEIWLERPLEQDGS